MATAGAVIGQTVMQLSQFIMNIVKKVMDLAQKMKDFLYAKWKTAREYLQRSRQHLQNFIQNYKHHIQTLLEVAKFYPIISLVLLVIAIFTDLFRYVLMVIAYLVLAIVLVAYELLSLPPFIWVLFILFFLIFEVVPLLVFTAVFLTLLVVVTLICLLVAGIDKLLGGRLRFLILCQNSPGAWYLTPSHQYRNKYQRGALCSKPCKTGYYPSAMSGSCVKLPKGAPSYCPQSQVMRVYTGAGKKDIHYDYRDIAAGRNMSYLLKTPKEREAMILKRYIEKLRYMDQCVNPENPASVGKYNHLTMNICSSIASLKANGFQNLSDRDFKKLERVCSQGFCEVGSSYPFCVKMSNVSSTDTSSLIKNIIHGIIAVTVFAMTVYMILQYMHEN